MKTAFFVGISIMATVMFISGNLQAAILPVTGTGNAYRPSEVHSILTDGVSLASGQYQIDLNLSGTVWQKGNDSHGWEPRDRIILRAFLDGIPIAEIIEMGLDGQNQKFEISLLLDFIVEEESKLQIKAFADATSKNERWRVSEAELNGQPIIPVPIANTIYLLAFGLLGLVGLRRFKQ